MKRKDFFKTLFSAAAAAVIAPKVLGAEPEMPPVGKFKSTSHSIIGTDLDFYDGQMDKDCMIPYSDNIEIDMVRQAWIDAGKIIKRS